MEEQKKREREREILLIERERRTTGRKGRPGMNGEE